MKCGKAGTRVPFMLLIILISSLLCACGQKQLKEVEWVPQDTSLIEEEDGTLTEMIFDQLDRSYYSASELQSQVQAAVKEYNSGPKATGPTAIMADEIVTEGYDIVLTLHYASWKDYQAFNNIPAFYGSMLEAEMAGFRFSGDFYAVEEGKIKGGKMSYEVPLSHKEYQVMIADASYTVSVPNNIVYISGNAAPLNSKVAKAVIPHEEETLAPEGEGGAQEEENTQAFDNSQKKSENEQNLIYVVYDYLS